MGSAGSCPETIFLIPSFVAFYGFAILFQLNVFSILQEDVGHCAIVKLFLQ